MKAALREFEQQLKEIIGSPTSLRPFICEGSPLECNVFIVGSNPATQLRHSWWHYWNTEYGFNKEKWLVDYIEERKTAPLKPGKTRRTKISSTRQRIEWIVDEVLPLKCLETNVFSVASERESELDQSQKATEPIEFLIKAITPQIILFHGDEAISIAEKRYSIRLPKKEPIITVLHGHSTTLYAVSHLARGWSQEATRELGRKLKVLYQE